MKFERKHYIYIMLAIILSIVAISAEISTDDLNNKYNKTDETDYLETPRIYYQSGSTNNYLTMNSGSVLAWLINNSITTNKIELQISKVKLYSDLDMNSHNVTNCLNCGTGTDNLSWQTEKYNITGGNITGNISVNGGNFLGNPILSFQNPNGSINAQADNQGNFDSIFSNNYVSGGSALNFALFQNIGNTTSHINAFQARRARGEIYSNGTAKIYPLMKNDTIFRIIGTGWDGTAWSGTTAKIEFQASQNFTISPFYRPVKIVFGVTADNEYVNSIDSVVIENHNLTVYGQRSSGTGYDYVCVERSTGKQINSAIACDLI